MSHSFNLHCWLRRLYRRGPRFQQHSHNLMKSEKFSLSEISTYQHSLLQRMIRHCYNNVPYYRNLFNELGLRPEHIQTTRDLQYLPLLDKQTVQDNLEQFISKKHRNFLCNIGTTSGSTGLPGQFIRDYDAINFEHAVVWRHWRNAGDHGKRRASLRGDIIVPSSQNHPPFWKYNPASKELMMSSYHLSQKNSVHYIDKILQFQPRILYCGPSMGYVLAKFFRMNNVSYQFDAVFTSSESLEPNVREYIEQSFHCRIYDWYGQAERVAAIGQCAYGIYHVQEDYSIVEFLPTAETGIDEVVGTQLVNFVMPLLRYRTQDFVTQRACITSRSCRCGSFFRSVDSIIGRAYGYLLTPEGYQIAITTHIPVGVDNVLEAQFHQDKQGEVILKVLTNGEFNDSDREKLVLNTRKHTSPNMQVIIEEVAEIPRGPNGKFINIVSTISHLESLN